MFRLCCITDQNSVSYFTLGFYDLVIVMKMWFCTFIIFYGLIWSVLFVGSILQDVEECLNSFADKISRAKELATCRLSTVYETYL